MSPSHPDRSVRTASVKYNPYLARALIYIGAVLFGVGVGTFVWTSSGVLYLAALGAPLVVLGILYRTRTYFTYDPDTQTIMLRAPLGPVVRPYELGPGSRLVYDGSRIVAVHPDGSRTRIAVNRWWAERNSWKAVVSRLDTV